MRILSVLVLLTLALALSVRDALAQRVQLTLRDGRVIEGRQLPVSRVDEKPDAISADIVKNIILVDDGLRQTFIPKRNIVQAVLAPAEQMERFRLQQRYSDSGKSLDAIGVSYPLSPFDEYGRRAVSVPGASGGSETLIQSITEINPRYLRIQTLHYVWDMRMATAALSRSVLTPILLRQIRETNIDDRKRLIRFYIQANQLDDAATELASVTSDFPDAAEELAPLLRRIRTMASEHLLDEITARAAAGQYATVRYHLDALASNNAYDHATPETLQRARRMLQDHDAAAATAKRVVERLKDLVAKSFDANADIDARRRIAAEEIVTEIEQTISHHTVSRFATFLLHSDNPAWGDAERLSVGISAWFVGADTEVRALATALSLQRVRDLTAAFLTEEKESRRDEVLAEIRREEAGTPPLVARVVALMRPAAPLPGEPTANVPGYYEIEVPAKAGVGIAGTAGIDLTRRPDLAEFRYAVQLPPEYSPDRAYPMIISLNGVGATPRTQIDFWCGSPLATVDGNTLRNGHASRQGFIVLAPEWNPAYKSSYDFSAQAHVIVLAALRDATARLHVDTDRVFITGHDTGGDAAWDIGMAHPDLWGGVIPFGALSGKYINVYEKHALLLPFYYIGGELEGFRNIRKSVLNAKCFNDYLEPFLKPREATVVLYRGRGMDQFADEIPTLFDWMRRHPRDFAPQSFQVRTIRSWDNFFWSVELGQIGEDIPELIRDPAAWFTGMKSPTRAIGISAEYQASANRLKVVVTPLAPRTEIYLTPDMLDFNNPADVTLNNRSLLPPRTDFVEPDVGVILEDVRTRRDRLHPFWVRLARQPR